MNKSPCVRLLFVGLLLLAFATCSRADTWTTGDKKLLFIRIDFADNPGAPISEATANAEMKKVADFLRDNSYGKLRLTWDITPVVRMPKTYTEYEQYRGSLFKDFSDEVHNAARQAGFDYGRYQFDVISYNLLPRSKRSVPDAPINKVNGVGLLHHRGVLLTNDEGRTIAHELGHNLGLRHEHGAAWITTDGTPIGDGKRAERGNCFDRMGNGYFWEAHFNSAAKYQLGWLDESSIARVKESGTYMIQAQDSPNGTGLRALCIPIPGSTKSYWVEFRQLFKSNDWTSNGLLVHWLNADKTVDLLDMTPGSKKGREDAALVIGRTFSDPQSNIHITPLRLIAGQNGEPSAIETRVEIGIQNNHPPELELHAPAIMYRGEKAKFDAVATDPDGDELSYFWEFNDGLFTIENIAAIEPQFEINGPYSVTCWVSDRKGGVAKQTVNFAVQSR